MSYIVPNIWNFMLQVYLGIGKDLNLKNRISQNQPIDPKADQHHEHDRAWSSEEGPDPQRHRMGREEPKEPEAHEREEPEDREGPEDREEPEDREGPEEPEAQEQEQEPEGQDASRWPKDGPRCFCRILRCPFAYEGYMGADGVCASKVAYGHNLACRFINRDGMIIDTRGWTFHRSDIQIIAALAKSGRLKKDE